MEFQHHSRFMLIIQKKKKRIGRGMEGGRERKRKGERKGRKQGSTERRGRETEIPKTSILKAFCETQMSQKVEVLLNCAGMHR